MDHFDTCDAAGFALVADGTSTSRGLAFTKVEARVRGTALAAQALDA